MNNNLRPGAAAQAPAAAYEPVQKHKVTPAYRGDFMILCICIDAVYWFHLVTEIGIGIGNEGSGIGIGIVNCGIGIGIAKSENAGIGIGIVKSELTPAPV